LNDRFWRKADIGLTRLEWPLLGAKRTLHLGFVGYSAAQLAQRWGETSHHIRRLCASGELQSLRLGTLIRISAEEVARIENPPALTTKPPAFEIGHVIGDLPLSAWDDVRKRP
jgi:excisionase family DNA binding protein